MRRVRLAVAGLVAAAALAGCSGGEEASQTLPSTSSTSASPSATLPPLGPADFPVPAEARQQTAPGAEAAMRYFFALTSRQAGLGGQPLRDISRQCTFCTQLADQYDKDIREGLNVRGGEVAITSMSTPALHDGIAEFSVGIHQSAVKVTDTSGQPVPGRGSPDVDVSIGASMAWSDQLQGWLTNQIVTDR